MSEKETEGESEREGVGHGNGRQSEDDIVEFLAPKKVEKEIAEDSDTVTKAVGKSEQKMKNESHFTLVDETEKFSCATLLENIVRPRDVVSIVNIQEEALRKINNSTRYLEQFNVRSESLLQQDDVGPKLHKQIEQLTLLTWQMQNITQRVQRLAEKVDSELKLNE